MIFFNKFICTAYAALKIYLKQTKLTNADKNKPNLFLKPLFLPAFKKTLISKHT